MEKDRERERKWGSRNIWIKVEIVSSYSKLTDIWVVPGETFVISSETKSITISLANFNQSRSLWLYHIYVICMYNEIMMFELKFIIVTKCCLRSVYFKSKSLQESENSCQNEL